MFLFEFKLKTLCRSHYVDKWLKSNFCSDENPSLPKVRAFGNFLPQARVYGASKPGVMQVPKSSPVPLARVCGAVVLIHNVQFMCGRVFGCRKLIRVVFVYVGGGPAGNIIKLFGDDFGTDAFFTKMLFLALQLT